MKGGRRGGAGSLLHEAQQWTKEVEYPGVVETLSHFSFGFKVQMGRMQPMTAFTPIHVVWTVDKLSPEPD